MWAISALNGLFNEDLCTGLLGFAFLFQVSFLLFTSVYYNMLAQVLYRCVSTSFPGIKSHWWLAEPGPKRSEMVQLLDQEQMQDQEQLRHCSLDVCRRQCQPKVRFWHPGNNAYDHFCFFL